MTLANTYLVFSLLILFLFAGMFFFSNRFKKEKKLSPLAGLSAAFIVAGIFFGNNRRLGYGLLAVGIVLAVSDIIAKLRSVGGNKQS